MPDINFQQLFDELKQGVTQVAATDAANYISQATADGAQFLAQLESDLRNWTVLLATGQLKPDDFADLVAGKGDLLQMAALKQAGLAEIALDKFKDDLLNIIQTTVFSFIKI